MLKNTDTSEKDFQNHIIQYLKSHGYLYRSNSDYNVHDCLDRELLLNFIKKSQPRQWEKFQRTYKNKSEQEFLKVLKKQLQKKNTIEIMRFGIKDVGAHFKLFFPLPNSQKNPELIRQNKLNTFSVIEELKYQKRDGSNRVDLVIFINGIPIISIELKDTFSQGVENAIRQYEKDRDQRERLFQICLVHFAVSDEKIMMTTKLKGSDTKFLPFNKGVENPEAPEGEFKTSYLYREILEIKQLSKLISHFVHMEGRGNNSFPIFPRYHQLDCVNQLLATCKPGDNFLIQHSAGSGKTKTIAWLAHGLIEKFDQVDNRIYDMIIVISDRRVIDRQLQDQIRQIQKVRGIVQVIDKNSEQLLEAMSSGTNIVVTTLQKFPFIMDSISELPSRNYAVIVDEAHSSQSGIMSRKFRQILSCKSLDEAEKIDRETMSEVEKQLDKDMETGRQNSNMSFFAFTATPKSKTLEMFGEEKEPEGYVPFHVYSMKQAIKEGFIIDVLQNYISYETFFKLTKSIKDDPEYNETSAKKLLRKHVEKNPYTIKKKTKIILEHFMESSIKKIKGKAKAMVLTPSRLHAVRYKRAFDKLIKENMLNIKALVAFTGTVKDNHKEFTETKMNNLPGGSNIKQVFEKKEYRFLIVANKFQTGFDQPLLHTMYVDKRINGVSAVQTLSRANRIHPDKEDTLVLDFANDPETIKKAFHPYYEVSTLEKGTDYHKLYDLSDSLLDFRIFYEDEVENFVNKFKSGVGQAELHRLLNPVRDAYRDLDKQAQVEFKKYVKRYISIYSFLSQIIPFTDISLEKMFIYCRYLYKKLPTINDPLPFSVLQDVDLDSYKIVNRGGQDIELNESVNLKPLGSSAVKYKPQIIEKLSKIIKDLNDVYGTDFNENDKVLLNQMKDNLLQNKELSNKIKQNSKNKVSEIFNEYFIQEMNNLLDGHLNFFNKITGNDKIKSFVQKQLLNLVYEEQAPTQQDLF